MSDQAREEREKLLLDFMLDWIQELAKLDFPISVSDQIMQLLVGVNVFDTPTTRLVTNVEDLTNVLEGTTDGADDVEEEIGELTDSRPPATVPT